MKKLSQTQFFVAALVLILTLAMVAILAEGLKKYDNDLYRSETELNNARQALPPGTPDAVVQELLNEEESANAVLQAEMEAEMKALEEEEADVYNSTQSYE